MIVTAFDDDPAKGHRLHAHGDSRPRARWPRLHPAAAPGITADPGGECNAGFVQRTQVVSDPSCTLPAVTLLEACENMDIDLTQYTETELIELNRRIVERIKALRSARCRSTMAEFCVGDRVSFEPESGP